MDPMTACILPETVPAEEIVSPLLQVFGRIVYTQAVEDEPLEPDILSPFIREMFAAERLLLHIPAPLGAERDRFLTLARDLQNRRDDYAGQLSMLTLAGLGQREAKESGSAILSQLLHRGNKEAEGEREGMLLWQARLVLKLAEVHDNNQREIRAALGRISKRQEQLLEELREEAISPFALTGSLSESAAAEVDPTLPHRLRAWSALFCCQPFPWRSPVFVTTHQSAVDTLEETGERLCRQSPRLLATFDLPAGYGWPAGDETTGPAMPRNTLQDLVQCGKRPAADLAQLLPGWADQWNRTYGHRFPGEDPGCRLSVHSLSGITAPTLFSAAFAGRSAAAGNLAPAAGECTLIAHLERLGKD
jgi:hypothetical protein